MNLIFCKVKGLDKGFWSAKIEHGRNEKSTLKLNKERKRGEVGNSGKANNKTI
jgi:hypothetical protein